jgi:hypothetical protein
MAAGSLDGGDQDRAGEKLERARSGAQASTRAPEEGGRWRLHGNIGDARSGRQPSPVKQRGRHAKSLSGERLSTVRSGVEGFAAENGGTPRQPLPHDGVMPPGQTFSCSRA